MNSSPNSASRLLYRIMGWLSRKTQCRAVYETGTTRTYCQRHIWHLGSHRDYWGYWP